MLCAAACAAWQRWMVYERHAALFSTMRLPELHKISDNAEAGRVHDVLNAFGRVEAEWPPASIGVLYNAVFKAYTKAANMSGAIAWYSSMRRKSIDADRDTFGELLTLAAFRGKLQTWLRDGERTGRRLGAAKCALVIEAFAAANQVVEATRWLDRMERSGVTPPANTVKSVVRAFGRCGDFHGAERMLEVMARHDVEAETADYAAAMEACAQHGEAKRAHELALQMEANGVQPCASVLGSLVESCARAGDFDSAEMWFRRLSDWFHEHGTPPKALSFKEFVKTTPVDASTLNASGFMPSLALCNAAMAVHASRLDASRAEDWFQVSRKLGVRPSAASYDTLITALASQSRLVDAQQWLKRMTDKGFTPSLGTFRSLIGAFAQQTDVANVARYVSQLRDAGMKPDADIFAVYMGACARSRPVARNQAESAFREMAAIGLQPNQAVGTALKEIFGPAGWKRLRIEVQDGQVGERHPDPRSRAAQVDGDAQAPDARENEQRHRRGRRPNSQARWRRLRGSSDLLH